MPEPLQADLELSVEGAIQNVHTLGDQLDTALTSGTDTLEKSLSDVITGLPPLELTPDTSTLETGVADALTSEPHVVPIDADVTGAKDELDTFAATAAATPIELPLEADTTNAQAAVDDLGTSAASAGSSLGEASHQTEGFGEKAGILAAGAELATGKVGGLKEVASGIGVAGAAGAAGAFALATGVHELFTEGLAAVSAGQRFNFIVGDMKDRVESVKVGTLDTELGKLGIQFGSTGAEMQNATSSLFQFASTSGAGKKASADFANEVEALSARAVALKPSLGNVGDVAEQMGLRIARGGKFASNYGLALTAAEINARALTDTQKASTGELTIYEKSQAAVNIAVERYGKVLGKDVAEGAKNAANQQKSLQAQLKEIIEETGRPLVVPLLDAFRDALPAVLALAKPLVTIAVDAIPVLVTGLEALTPPLQLVSDVMSMIPAPALTAGAALLVIGPAFGVIKSAAAGVGTWLEKAQLDLVLTGTAAETSGAEIEAGGAQAIAGGEEFAAAGTIASEGASGFEVAGAEAAAGAAEVEAAGAAAATGGEGFALIGGGASAALPAVGALMAGVLIGKTIFPTVKGLAEDLGVTFGTDYAAAAKHADDVTRSLMDSTGGPLVKNFKELSGALREAGQVDAPPLVFNLQAFRKVAEQSVPKAIELKDALHLNAEQANAYNVVLSQVIKKQLDDTDAKKKAGDEAAALAAKIQDTLIPKADLTATTFQHGAQVFGFWAAAAATGVGLTTDALDAAAKSADDFSSSIESSIQGATDPFTHTFPDAVHVSEKEMEDFLVGSQLDAAAWVGEIKGLIEKGVNVGIVDEIAKAGPKSKPQLDAFVKVVDEKGADWVNSVEGSASEAAQATEASFRAQVLSAATHMAEMNLIVKAQTADIASNGTHNLEELTKNSDKSLAQMARDALSHLADIRAGVDGLPTEHDIEVLVAVRSTLSEDDQRLFDFIQSLHGVPLVVSIGGSPVPITAEGGIFDEPQIRSIAEVGPEAVIPLNDKRRAMEIMKAAGLLPAAPEYGQVSGPLWGQAGPQHIDNSVTTTVDARGQTEPDATRIGIAVSRRQRADMSARSG